MSEPEWGIWEERYDQAVRSPFDARFVEMRRDLESKMSAGADPNLARKTRERVLNGYDYEDIIEEERQMEKDLRMLQSMYPEAVKKILPCVEEICDRMEYEGSMMFDEHPDKITIRRLSDEIYEQTGDVWPEEPVQEPDGVMSMQYQGDGRGALGELIQILLLQEMYHRRCRHHRCRPHMF